METVFQSSSTFEFIAADEDGGPALRPNASLDDLLQEHFQDTRSSVITATESAWERINMEFLRIKELRANTLKEFRSKKGKLYSEFSKSVESMHSSFKYDELSKSMENLSKGLEVRVRSELDLLKKDTKTKARSMWSRILFYSQVLILVGPLVVLLYVLVTEAPRILLCSIFYFFVLAIVLVWHVIVPPMKHKGINYFKPYEMPESERKQVEDLVEKAKARMAAKPKQKVYTEEEREKPTFILSLDGGGIKGVVVAQIILRISEEFPEFLERVDLVAGCSTGSILTGFICAGYKPDEIVEFFKLASPLVFRTTVWQQLKQFGLFAGTICDGAGKLDIFRKGFFGLKLSELRCGCVVTASHVVDEYEVYQCVPRVWTNVVEHTNHAYVGHHDFELGGDPITDLFIEKRKNQFSVLDMELADVVNGATAAPLYFPSHQNHVDGVLFSNNPAMAALATVTPMRDLKNVTMLSIGTGVTSKSVKEGFRNSRFGLLQWLPFLLDFFIDATSTAAHFNVKAILQDKYHRIDPILPARYNLSDVSAVDELVEIAKRVDLEPTFTFLEGLGLRRKCKKE